ncbi:hypothetical protein HWQ46_19265 [Shewanella sp. D64]|uniref:hypothetical protein n=1 Tax=unclassified Shewanella TaxID=196818 RepID=UPI0022BA2ACF|nr:MULTISPECIES: hypothetical protein [unclassified Shewanella]MEC4727689.1 hypothetical protein [Shewanella sp. D64]MEC4739738.1 hypothetical protein [Shewanella sp. E94]WBJ94085.1 hypothetical protein HWQ47_19580 [Shewanella sp. MTB7]
MKYLTLAWLITLPLLGISNGYVENRNLPQKATMIKMQYLTKSSTQVMDKALAFSIPKSMNKKLNAIQWTMKAGTVGRPILSGNHYQLVNLASNRGLKRQSRTIAANLGFLKTSSKKMNMLVKRKKGAGQLKYGDIVALNLKPYGWLKYKKQRKGINISDDDRRPHYIWKIGGGKNGTKLLSGMPFSLYNTTPEKNYVVYCKRTWGIDLGWLKTSKCGGWAANLSAKAFGANGALSGDGMAGGLAKNWRDKLCKAAVGSASAYITAQSGGTTGAAVAAAAPKAIKQCNKW